MMKKLLAFIGALIAGGLGISLLPQAGKKHVLDESSPTMK
jgi:hypothetical protein